MGIAGGNMYEFVSKTWNPLVGMCEHNCSYCSTNGFRNRFAKMRELYSGEPRINENQMNVRFKETDTVFVCSQNDLFADNVPGVLIARIIDYCKKYPAKYVFQTKNPERIILIGVLVLHIPINFEVGITLESDIYYTKIMGNSPIPEHRVKAIEEYGLQIDFITIEPIMEFSDQFLEMLKSINPKQINIGADSGRNNLPEPSKEKVLKLISELETFTKVHRKKNLERIIK